jgi:hypothetical protein
VRSGGRSGEQSATPWCPQRFHSLADRFEVLRYRAFVENELANFSPKPSFFLRSSFHTFP